MAILAGILGTTKILSSFGQPFPLCYAIDSLKDRELAKLLKNRSAIYKRRNQSPVKFCNDGSSPYV